MRLLSSCPLFQLGLWDKTSIQLYRLLVYAMQTSTLNVDSYLLLPPVYTVFLISTPQKLRPQAGFPFPCRQPQTPILKTHPKDFSLIKCFSLQSNPRKKPKAREMWIGSKSLEWKESKWESTMRLEGEGERHTVHWMWTQNTQAEHHPHTCCLTLGTRWKFSSVRDLLSHCLFLLVSSSFFLPRQQFLLFSTRIKWVCPQRSLLKLGVACSSPPVWLSARFPNRQGLQFLLQKTEAIRKWQKPSRSVLWKEFPAWCLLSLFHFY